MKHNSCAKEYEMDIIMPNYIFDKQRDEITKQHGQCLKHLDYMKYNGCGIKCYSAEIQ